MTTPMFYLPAEGIDPATIYGGEDITCISPEEIQRLSTEWGTDVMSQMRPATPEEMAEYGIYGHACTLWEIWTAVFEVRLGKRKGDVWTDVELLREFCGQDSDPWRRESYTTKDDAMQAFARDWANCGSTNLRESYGGGYFLLCSIAYLEPAEYDADGEYIQGGDWAAESVEAYVPTIHDLALTRADTDLIVRLINAEDSWDDDQYNALLELADRAGLEEETFQDDDGDTDVHAFVCAIQDALGVDLGE